MIVSDFCCFVCFVQEVFSDSIWAEVRVEFYCDDVFAQY